MLDFFLWRLLRGYAEFRASGGFAARFLNLCDAMRLHVWDLQFEGGDVCGRVSCRDYRRLRLAAGKAGMRLRCTGKRGLPFFLRRSRARWGLAVGAAVCAGLAVFLSGFLWSVETGDVGAVNEQALRAAAAQIGLYPGAKKPSMNGEDLAVALRRQMDGALSWAAVNVRGCRAVLEAREAAALQTLPDPAFGAPCDLVADFDGLLLQLEVHSGEKKNAVGNGVKTGDLLISGTRLDREGKPHYYEARGVVTALHEDARTMETPSALQLERVVAVRRVPVLHLWHLSLPLGVFPRCGTCTACTRTESAVLHGVTLPFSLEWRTRCYWAACEAEAAPLAFDSFVLALNERYRATRVLSGEVSAATADGVLTLTQRSRVIDFMGVKRPLAAAQPSQAD